MPYLSLIRPCFYATPNLCSSLFFNRIQPTFANLNWTEWQPTAFWRQQLCSKRILSTSVSGLNCTCLTAAGPAMQNTPSASKKMENSLEDRNSATGKVTSACAIARKNTTFQKISTSSLLELMTAKNFPPTHTMNIVTR